MLEEDDNDNTVLEEEEAPQIFATSGDTNLPHILKIGQQGYAEYIDLGSMPTRKEGINSSQFNQFQIGNRLLELQKMYNVVGKENIIAMQRAFGVRSLHEDPPIVKNIQDGCLPLDFKLVQKALQYRIGTLKTRIGLKEGQLSSKSDERRLKWIESILEQTKGITKTCTGPTKETQTNTQINAQTETQTNTPTSEYACLSDMNLLRDLVYILSLIQGVTNPEIKKQLEKITLRRLLASARNSSAEPPKNILQDIIVFLEKNIDLLDNEDENNTKQETQQLLLSIYNTIMSILDKDQLEEDIPVDRNMIMEALRDVWEHMRELQSGLERTAEEKEDLANILEQYIDDMEKAKREIISINKELEESRVEALGLYDIIIEYSQELDKGYAEIIELREKLAQQTIDYRAGIDELMRFNDNQRTRIQEYYEQIIRQKNALIGGLTANNEELRRLVAGLEAQMAALIPILEERDQEIDTLHDTVEAQQEIENATTEAASNFQRRLRECEEEGSRLRAQLEAVEASRNAAAERATAAEAARNAAIGERNAAAAAATAAEAARNAAIGERNAAAGERETAAEAARNAAIGERNAAGERATAAEAARNAAIGERNAAGERATAAEAARNAAAERATAAEAARNAAAERGALAATTAAAEKAAIQRDIDELRNRLEALQEDVGTRQARITELEAEVAKLRGQLETLGAEKEEQRRKCEEDIAAKTREIAELNRTKDAAVAEKEVRIAALQKQLEALTTQLAEKDAQLNEKNRQLAADKEEKEQFRAVAAAAEATGKEAGEAAATLRIENDTLRRELNRLRENLTTESGKLAALTSSNIEFKKRLENLLNLLLVDPRLREMAQRFMDGEGDAESPPPELKAPSAEMCTFFQYLTTVVNLQMRKLTTSSLSPEIKRDILTIYAELPEVDKIVLLKELTDFFQKVFAHISQARSIQAEGFALEGGFPQIATAFGKQVRADLRGGSPKSQIFLNELGSFGFLSRIIVVPTGVSNMSVKKVQGVGIPTVFVGENTIGETPLVVMGIKYIQLLAEVLNTKYSEIARQCGLPAGSPIAVESEPEDAPPPPAPAPKPIASPPDSIKTRALESIQSIFSTGGSLISKIPAATIKIKSGKADKYDRAFLEGLLGMYLIKYFEERGKNKSGTVIRAGKTGSKIYNITSRTIIDAIKSLEPGKYSNLTEQSPEEIIQKILRQYSDSIPSEILDNTYSK